LCFARPSDCRLKIQAVALIVFMATISEMVSAMNDNAASSHKFTNRLIGEDSAYLQQHAHNPVNWYPWGDEAFAVAVRDNKPVFLSIGYSTCHWCHVMEAESFENEEIAALLNEHFISIKVDREQRPDLDEIYMTAVQIFSGRGGWPMSSFLTPEGQPFFGATYFPPDQFTALLHRVASLWKTREQQLRATAAEVTANVDQYMTVVTAAAQLDQALLDSATAQLIGGYDGIDGGFTEAPKFPNETLLLFLLDQLKRHPSEQLMKPVLHTLNRMAQGGLYDQVGGGFHRYSTDPQWLVPHFEKMLYNQALLSQVYSDAYLLTANTYYKNILVETLDYVLRDMTAAGGAFYSATDADSEGEEGLFFLWTRDELQQVLSDPDFALVEELYEITPAGNFEGRNLLHLPRLPAQYTSFADAPWRAHLSDIKRQLHAARERRIHPLLDTKVITAWNGMMISALAQASVALDETRYLAAAEAAADYVWRTHIDQAGELWRISLDGKVSIAATQEDYAYLAEGLIALFDVTARQVWLQRAQKMATAMVERFMDSEAGGFYMSVADANGPLISRIKSTHDGAIPSGNSVALSVLLKLAVRTGDTTYRQLSQLSLAFLSGRIHQHAGGYTFALKAVQDHLAGEINETIYLAEGHVRASVRWLHDDSFRVRIDMDDNWHLNAHEVLQEKLVPTTLTVEGVDVALVFPPPQMKTVKFQEQPLALYQQSVDIVGRVSGLSRSEPMRLILHAQACDDEHCLRPEQITLLARARPQAIP
jgi:uncharacterized protein YyaL (SSP411 family)